MFVKRRSAVILVAGLAMCFGLSAALNATPADNDIKLPKLEFREVKLDNGLRVILVPDHSAPVYAIDVCYNVGSRNERPGRTGFAHLFEHMMYQGSENVGKGEHFILVLNNGGGMNGTTNEDRSSIWDCFWKPTACAR
jgi:zinc protease